MRIGCLQFAPQKGDVSNNLSRAESVLLKESPEDLDLLVLPELAFSGHQFKSLNEICPFLEPSGSGISSLWARTTALKYDCTVVVGYPEKVDTTSRWPASPEFYNSVIVVNNGGETIGSYRKNHLHAMDETWALEGQGGFFSGPIESAEKAVVGLSMDLNPYRFQSPWEVYEFAVHTRDTEATLAIVSMAWPAEEESSTFTRSPQEPDMETLLYWISRLEPLICRRSQQEVIVVFANRTGVDDEFVYAGTSAVVGILNGEVRVYGLLGRGEKELLVVDTKKEPFGKLVYRPDGVTSAVESRGCFFPDPKAMAVPPPPPPPPAAPVRDISKKMKMRPGGAFAPPIQTQFQNPNDPILRAHTTMPNPITPLSAMPLTAVPQTAFPRSKPPQLPVPHGTLKHERQGSAGSAYGPRHFVPLPTSAMQSPSPISPLNKPGLPKLSLQTDPSVLQGVPSTGVIQTPCGPTPTPMGIRPRFSVPPAEQLTHRYIESQRNMSYSHPNSLLKPSTGPDTPYPGYEPGNLTPHPRSLRTPVTPATALIYGGEVTIETAGTAFLNEYPRGFRDFRHGVPSPSKSDGTEFSEFSSPSTRRGPGSIIRSLQLDTHSATGSVAGSNSSPRVSGSEDADTSLRRPESRKSGRARSRNTSEYPAPTRRPDMDNILKRLGEIARRVNQANQELESKPASRSSSVAHAKRTHSRSDSSKQKQDETTASDPQREPSRKHITGTPVGAKDSPPYRPQSRGRPRVSAYDVAVGNVPPHTVLKASQSRKSSEQRKSSEGRKSSESRRSPESKLVSSIRKSTEQSRSRSRVVEPLDLSQFQVIEEYTCASCPLHGSPESRQPSRNESRHDSESQARASSRGSRDDRRSISSGGRGTPELTMYRRQRSRAPKMSNLSQEVKPASHQKKHGSSRKGRSRSSTHSRDTVRRATPAPEPVLTIDPRIVTRSQSTMKEIFIADWDERPWVEQWMPPAESLDRVMSQSAPPEDALNFRTHKSGSPIQFTGAMASPTSNNVTPFLLGRC